MNSLIRDFNRAMEITGIPQIERERRMFDERRFKTTQHGTPKMLNKKKIKKNKIAKMSRKKNRR